MPVAGLGKAGDMWVSAANRRDARYVFLASVALNILALALPLALLQVYDRIIPNSSRGTLLLMIAGVAGVVCLEALMRVARADIISWMGSQIEHRAGTKAFGRLMGAPAEELERTGAGELIERFSGLPMVREVFTEHWTLVACDLPFAVIFIATIWFLAGWLVLAPLVMIAVIVAVAASGSKKAEQALTEFNTIRDRRQNFTIEAIHGIHAIKSMAMEGQMIQRLARLQEAVAKASHQVVLANSSVLSNGATFSQLSTLVVVVLGAALVVDNALTIGGLSACTLLTGRVLQPVQKAVSMWSRYQSAEMMRERFETLFELPPEHPEGTPPLQIGQGGIELKGVSFAYGDADPVFANVNLRIGAGARVAIAGDNGSGKSTLLRLMYGSMAPTTGEVLIDGQPVAYYDRNGQETGGIAYVPQRGELFKGTILDNLTMFRPRLRREAIQIANDLDLDDVVYRLPNGYLTRVGEGSSEALPRGVAQRIAVVRALVCRPRVLLFDEANAAMDNSGDEHLRRYFEALDRTTTLVMVTLRPSLQKLADQVLQIERGRLVPARPREAAPLPTLQDAVAGLAAAGELGKVS
ncbi:MAG: ATP-binding cassette domain-containing protein [Magnetospirillum sp.]|nr:ATP-binding cassette domain-containing protein [Magnetospirillum sp.]